LAASLTWYMAQPTLCRRIVALVLGCQLATTAAGAVSLQSHRAVYDLSLESAESASGVAALDGRLVAEWQDGCDGYVFNQRNVTRLHYQDGEEYLSDYRVATWEARDGLAMRFDVEDRLDGEPIERFRGQARLVARGGAGEVVFNDPAETRPLELSPGTIFPSELTEAVLREAGRGTRYMHYRLFNGTGPEGVYEVSVFVTALYAAADAEVRPLLSGVASWRLHLAYFTEPGGGLPEYELGFRVYANGIATDFEIDHGYFAVRGTLVELAPLPKIC